MFKRCVRAGIVITLAMMFFCGLSMSEDGPQLSRDYKYWRGHKETTPGPFLCVEPAATDVFISCDRWPDTSDLRKFGLDAIRLSGAKTETEKCLAVFRWLRRIMVNCSRPYEPFAHDGCWDGYFKWIHVYGGHYCSGMSRALEMCWRALGYRAAKVYTGHTVCDLHFTDHDGVDRWHHFDANRGIYMLDRSRKRLLSRVDLAVDSRAFFVHGSRRYQGHWSTHRAELSLRAGEKLERAWGHWGKLYQLLYHPKVKFKNTLWTKWCNPCELTPYDLTHGSGRWTYAPDISTADGKKGLAGPAINMASDKLMPNIAGTPASAAWHFRTPYIVSDMEADLNLFRKTDKDKINLYLSIDDGKTWKPVWKCPEDATGRKKVTANICEKFDVNKAKAEARKRKIPKDFNSPFGRYSFRVKLELVASQSPQDCRVEGITFRTVVQQNKFALPRLQPGRNQITVRGNLAEGAALRVTYVWDDPKGKGRRNVTVCEKLPHTYEIIAAGRKWKDCVCKSLVVEAVPASGKGSRTVEKEKPSKIHKLPPQPSVHEVSHKWMLSNRGTPVKLPPIEKVIRKLNLKTGRRKLQNIVVPHLIEHADPKAWEATVKLIADIVKLGKGGHEKYMKSKNGALTALYVMDPKADRVRAYLKDFVKDPEMSWGSEAKVAVMVKAGNWPEFIPYLAGALKKDKGWIIPTTILRTFVDIGGPETAAAVKAHLNDGPDVLGYAVLAAGRSGDRTMIPRLREIMRIKVHSRDNRRTAKINAAIGLGMLKDTESIPEIKEFLKCREQEAWRAKAAEALGYMGDKSCIPAIKEALEKEPVRWARKVMEESIRKLENGK